VRLERIFKPANAVNRNLREEGRTMEEAREMATDAIRAYCASLLKHGEPIPVQAGLPGV